MIHENGCQVCGEFLQIYHEMLQRVCWFFNHKIVLNCLSIFEL